jgi:LDH2 family malate/lactate/ureidoglycolate dehydrogenase
MMVLNPLMLMGKDQLKARMHEFFESVRQTPVSEEGVEILLPGEIEYRTECERKRSGIPLPAAVYEELIQIGNETDRSIEDDRS